ncbi:Rpn family recombination-promoting nuclease/putative transposase [Leptolyngbya sp. AN03gr2]|uniref:Rpn family recombination-promoting nuclease/putative transposase n=1 Tax=unclassified Leptolyngbya TaxID=2650499 RepID=UPI003D31B618
MTIDHDRLFKELLSTFFIEFLELFLPKVAETIERESIVFLQQEYFADLEEGEEKIIDLLVSVKQAGTDMTFLVHIEAQSYSQSNFNQRMFFYFARLHQKHLQRIYPIVVFSFDQPQRAEKNIYKVEFPDRKVLEFSFEPIQLNRLNWRNYLNQANPVAAALMAKMKIAKRDRPKVKAECLRILTTLQLDPARTRLISQFVDTYLPLDSQEKKVFQREIGKIEGIQQEVVMEIVTSWERDGMEKERQKIALRMLQQNCTVEFIAQMTDLSIEQIQHLRSQLQQ